MNTPSLPDPFFEEAELYSSPFFFPVSQKLEVFLYFNLSSEDGLKLNLRLKGPLPALLNST